MSATFALNKLRFILMLLADVLFASILRSRSGLIAQIHDLVSVFRYLLYSDWLLLQILLKPLLHYANVELTIPWTFPLDQLQHLVVHCSTTLVKISCPGSLFVGTLLGLKIESWDWNQHLFITWKFLTLHSTLSPCSIFLSLTTISFSTLLK